MRARHLVVFVALLAVPAFAQTPPPEPAPPPPAPSEEPTPPPTPPAEEPTTPPTPAPTPAPVPTPTQTPPAPAPVPPPPPPPPAPAPAQPAPQQAPPPASSSFRDRLYFGGSVGAAFGDIDYVELTPLVGYRLTPRISAGVSLFYRWKSDDRYANSVDTNDWGGSLFGRLQAFGPFFLAAEYEYGEYEYQTLTGTQTYSDTNVLAGIGFSRGAGRAGLYFLALYNFSYDEDDWQEPYDSPWVYRVGVSFGF